MSEEKRRKIVDLWRDKLPIKVIALEMDISYHRVYYQLKKLDLLG